jgi:hypothetical protein
MKKTKQILLIATIFVFLFSCSSSKTVTQSLSANKVSEDTYNYYDNDSKISYQIFNDAENLYVNLSTADKMAIIKILKSGLSIYFDENGKKNKTVSVEYPLHNSKIDFSTLRPKSNGATRPEMDINKLLASVPNNAVYRNYEDIERFNLDLNNTDISINLKSENSELGNQLVYQLKIPFHNISNLSISEIENFSIGIVSGKIEAPKRPSGISGGRPSGSGRPSGVGGGRPSGGGKPAGVGGGRPSGGGRPANVSSEITKQISIWFNVELLKQ